jgi:hypothetical protein
MPSIDSGPEPVEGSEVEGGERGDFWYPLEPDPGILYVSATVSATEKEN